jgi:hypothetical protein
MHNLLYMDVILYSHFIYHHSNLASLRLIILFLKYQKFQFYLFQTTKFCGKKKHNFLEYSKKIILDMKISKFMCKVWLLISNSTLLKDLIFWLNQLQVNYKSHISQLTIIMYHTKISKTLKFICSCCYLTMHDSHSSAFVFHLFI